MLRDVWMKKKRACLDISGAIRSNLARKREGKDRPEKEMVETQEKQTKKLLDSCRKDFDGRITRDIQLW